MTCSPRLTDGGGDAKRDDSSRATFSPPELKNLLEEYSKHAPLNARQTTTDGTLDCGSSKDLYGHDSIALSNYKHSVGSDLNKLGQALKSGDGKKVETYLHDATEKLNEEMNFLKHNHGSTSDIDLVNRAAGDLRAVQKHHSEGDSNAALNYVNCASKDVEIMSPLPSSTSAIRQSLASSDVALQSSNLDVSHLSLDKSNNELNQRLQTDYQDGGSQQDIDLTRRAAGDIRAAMKYLNEGDIAKSRYYVKAAVWDVNQMDPQEDSTPSGSADNPSAGSNGNPSGSVENPPSGGSDGNSVCTSMAAHARHL
ncbi:MAG: hypothetical protein HYX67_09300 [Candidatus Melainabacteria bacterium]|nr:hypothetical protein [Candidatus Melainabacteria bacterium]